jgi:hypothetical protein
MFPDQRAWLEEVVREETRAPLPQVGQDALGDPE